MPWGNSRPTELPDIAMHRFQWFSMRAFPVAVLPLS